MNDVTSDAALIAAATPSPEPDAHGQAALLLAESILHALVEAKVFSLEVARSVIATTCEVKIEIAEQTGESNFRMQESLALLRAISATFAVETD
ncbi:hypothetical protein [Sphingomonas sp. M1-B02]|uniref:hypothetical protein n=1 Tax=Sphingomonas sp. M1-B02 TaxID=3114300 RepID=UPI0022404C63|nr:hypothetical protein [Sphingomonas sp. S6-11]UZK65827.1 hypothetical protein OKW87_15145 [Sphingomonas sp. S6-11]